MSRQGGKFLEETGRTGPSRSVKRNKGRGRRGERERGTIDIWATRAAEAQRLINSVTG